MHFKESKDSGIYQMHQRFPGNICNILNKAGQHSQYNVYLEYMHVYWYTLILKGYCYCTSATTIKA